VRSTGQTGVRGRRGISFPGRSASIQAFARYSAILIPLHRKAAKSEFEAVKASNKGLMIMDYERMSNAELHALLKEKMPAVAETVGKVRDSNRETIIAFIRFVQTHQGKPV